MIVTVTTLPIWTVIILPPSLFLASRSLKSWIPFWARWLAAESPEIPPPMIRYLEYSSENSRPSSELVLGLKEEGSFDLAPRFGGDAIFGRGQLYLSYISDIFWEGPMFTCISKQWLVWKASRYFLSQNNIELLKVLLKFLLL